MMSRNPPPAPYRTNATLPHPPYPPSHHHQHAHAHGPHPMGETDISYSAYSPSPSSLSAHRKRLGHIRNWAFRNAFTVPRNVGSRGQVYDPSFSMGIGSATWSETMTDHDGGTTLSDSITDVGTVPTTVKGRRGVDAGPREKVDVRKAMSAKQGLQKRPNQLREEKEMEPSELPSRQSSLRRDVAPAVDKGKDKTKEKDTNQGRPNPILRQTSGRAPPVAPVDKANPPNPIASGQKQQHIPPMMYNKPRANKPTPQLARPPTPSPPGPEAQILPGTPLVTSPETTRPLGKPMSPLQLREAYLDSALNLPLDMLCRADAERIGLAVPGGAGLKAAKSTSSINSVLTTGRLASLVGAGGGGGRDGRSPNGGMKRVVSDSAALKAGVRQQGSTKTVAGKKTPTPDIELLATTNAAGPIRQAKSNQSSKTVKPSTATNPITQEPPRSLGSAPALGRSPTAPSKTKAPSPKVVQFPAEPQPISALGLDLGLPATITTITTTLLSDKQPPTQTLARPLPRAVTQLQPAPHRQLGALRRPALTPGNSTDNLANTLHTGVGIGRKSRDPSTTDLRLRFEPAMYPLPESKSSVERSQTDEVIGAGEETPRAHKLDTKATGGGKKGGEKQEAGRALMGTPKIRQGNEIGVFGQNAALQLGRALAGNSPIEASPGPGSRLRPAPTMLDRPGSAEAREKPKASPRPPLVRQSATISPPTETPLGSVSNDLSTPLLPATNPTALSPLTPLSPQDIIITPPPLPALRLDSHSDPRSHERPNDHGLGVSRLHGDDDRVSFEVPNGTRGRLRVSLAWFRDRAGGARPHAHGLGNGLATPSDAPPPLPPKGRWQGRLPAPVPAAEPKRPDRMDHRHELVSPPQSPSSPPSPARSPVPINSHQHPKQAPHPGQQTYIPDPRFPPGPLAGYPFQLGRPFIYPQPQPGVGPAWASLPHLALLQQQQQQQQGLGVRQMGSAGSQDLPSGDSPRGQMMDLPQRGFGIGMPMGMGMGMGMGMNGIQNGINPYSTRSLNPNPNPNPDHEQQHGYDQGFGNAHGHEQGGGPSQYQGQGQGLTQGHDHLPAGGDYNRQQTPYGKQGNNRPQSRWKRIFNLTGDGTGNRVQNWQENRRDPYHYNNANVNENRHANGNGNENGSGSKEGTVGNWIRGITPGRAPTATVFGGGIFQSGAKRPGRAQSFWTRRKGYDPPAPHDEYQDDPFAHTNVNGRAVDYHPHPYQGQTANEYHPQAPTQAVNDRYRTRNPYDNTRQAQGTGGLMDRFFSWPGRGRGGGRRDAAAGAGAGYYGQPNPYGNNPYRDQRTDRPDRDRQRRKDAERRNVRQTRRDEKGRNKNTWGWMGFTGTGVGNGNGYDARMIGNGNGNGGGRGRKLSNRKQQGLGTGQGRKGGKWKDRLPDRKR